jgi:hypothetical protein
MYTRRYGADDTMKTCPFQTYAFTCLPHVYAAATVRDDTMKRCPFRNVCIYVSAPCIRAGAVRDDTMKTCPFRTRMHLCVCPMYTRRYRCRQAPWKRVHLETYAFMCLPHVYTVQGAMVFGCSWFSLVLLTLFSTFSEWSKQIQKCGISSDKMIDNHSQQKNIILDVYRGLLNLRERNWYEEWLSYTR